MNHDLNAEYERLLASGEPIDLRHPRGQRAIAADGHAWNEKRTIKAEILVDLLTRPPDHEGWSRKSVWLAGFRIVGILDLEGATLTRPLCLEDCYMEMPIVLADAKAMTIRLLGCHISGLRANSLETRGDLSLKDGLVSAARVSLSGAHIGGALDCTNAELTDEHSVALDATLARVDGPVRLNGLRATGEVRLVGAHIGASLSCVGATFNNEGRRALDLERAKIDGVVLFHPASKPNGLIVLKLANVSGWEDSEGTWPERKGLLLNGFTYAAIVGKRRGTEEDGKFRQVSARQRLTWLLSDAEGFQPQPYEQLAGVLREQGHEQDACKMQVAGQFRRRVLPDSSLLLWPIRFAWSLLLWATIGYGLQAMAHHLSHRDPSLVRI